MALTTGQQEIPFSLCLKRDPVSSIQELSSSPSSVAFLATSACLFGSSVPLLSVFLPTIPQIVCTSDDADIIRDHWEFPIPSPCQGKVPGPGPSCSQTLFFFHYSSQASLNFPCSFGCYANILTTQAEIRAISTVSSVNLWYRRNLGSAAGLGR